jgi:hypothetical protein
MSINMTQAFEFETDDLKSFEKVLVSAISVMFHDKNDQYVQLHIDPTKGDDYWHDGGYDNSVAVYKNGNKFDVIKTQYIKNIQYAAKVDSFNTLDEAVKAAEKTDRARPTRLFVAGLFDYRSSIRKDSIRCKSQKEMHEEAMKLVQNVDINKLNEACGDGYSDGFQNFDGSIDVGYRMHYEPQGGWNCLYLSLVHMYYGK